MQKFQICFRRPEEISEFVDIMDQCEYEADLISGKNMVDAKSLLGVIAISRAEKIELVVYGEDLKELIGEIQRYFAGQKIA